MKKYLHVFVLAIFLMQDIQAQRKTGLFNEIWQFTHDTTQPSRLVTLPHDWSIEGPFSNEWASGTGFLPGGVGYYTKSFWVKGTEPGDKVFIYFDGVYKNSEVWLNGNFLGKRPNGYIPFEYELTPYLNDTSNQILVKADHSKFADSRWYPGSGIYRNVYLIVKKTGAYPYLGCRFYKS